MYRGTPAQFFFQCINLNIFQQILFRGARWVCIVIFKQFITNLGIHCALKVSCCQSFCGLMYPLKMNHQNFTLEGTLKKYEREPWDSGNIQHCTVSYNTSCNSDYNLTVQPNSDKYDVFYDLTI